jgi:hypothetical protein
LSFPELKHYQWWLQYQHQKFYLSNIEYQPTEHSLEQQQNDKVRDLISRHEVKNQATFGFLTVLQQRLQELRGQKYDAVDMFYR